jgi:hypothetical protein
MQSPIEKSKKPKTLNVSLVIGVVTLLIIVGVGGWLVHRKASTDQVYKYQKFDSYVLGTRPSISFTKPVELKQISKSPTEAELQHVINTSGSRRGVATYIAAAFVVTDVSASPQDIQSINEVLQKPKAPAYSTYTRNIMMFLNAKSPAGWKNDLSPAKQFTSNSIKTGAWTFDFTSSYQKLVDKGQVLYIVDGKVNYYFVMESTIKNWDYNHQAWLQILNSLKIND